MFAINDNKQGGKKDRDSDNEDIRPAEYSINFIHSTENLQGYLLQTHTSDINTPSESLQHSTWQIASERKTA
jgi:hypothetical protein